MGGPDYLNRNQAERSGPKYVERDTGVDWRRHEEEVAKRSGGRKRAASGAAPGKPADTVDQEFLRECKSTKGAGITLKSDWLKKIVQQSLPRDMIPLLELRMDGQEAPTPKDWVLLPAQEFEILLERLRREG